MFVQSDIPIVFSSVSWYCGWKKSCMTLDGSNLKIIGCLPPVSWCKISQPSAVFPYIPHTMWAPSSKFVSETPLTIVRSYKYNQSWVWKSLAPN